MNTNFCHSCSMPLNSESSGKNPQFCKYCTDEAGNLHSREQVQRGVAQFLKILQPQLDDSIAFNRADFYLKAMPAWAD